MADINRILISEYLESLKEDGELDHIFPLLLEMKGFKILSKPAEAKGQSQYGKDIVALADVDGVKTRFYFELKGGSDRNIDDHVLSKKDGVIESLRAAKYTPYIDNSIPDFASLPARYILVHNGNIKENARPTLNGFIAQEFKEGEFARWDLAELSKQFSENLFNEYLLVKRGDNSGLFKKTLALLDVPEYDLKHFYELINSLCKNTSAKTKRSRLKFYSALALIGMIIYTYCKSFNNLDRARLCINYIALKSWRWTLLNKLGKRPTVRRSFETILGVQVLIFQDYFNKTLPMAVLQNGMYMERGGEFEEMGYPIRTTDFINQLIYYIKLRSYFRPDLDRKFEIETLQKIIDNNPSGAAKPLLDNQSVAYLNVFIFLMENRQIVDSRDFLIGYLDLLFENIGMIKNLRHRLPELYNNEHALAVFLAEQKRPYNYEDRSSTLILILFELTVCLNAEEIYNKYRSYFVDTKVNLQTFYHLISEENTVKFFDQEIQEEGHSETNIELPEKFGEFRDMIAQKELLSMPDESKKFMEMMKLLAHATYKTPFYTNDWRKYFNAYVK